MSDFGSQINDSGAEFFFRVTDRLQMDSCLAALANDSKSVVIFSQSSELLDYYGAAFVRRVKQKLATSQVEIFMPRDTEAMLDRFNKLLNALSLDVAVASRAGQAPEKVWVVYDANALGAHELQLLTRLIQQFPGAAISIVLMFSSETTQNEDVTRPNKQFVSWGLDLPTPEQKLSAIQQARQNGTEETAIQFFNRLSKAAAKKAAATSTLEAIAAPRKLQAQAPKAVTPQKKRVWPWLLGVAGLLLISLATALFLNPEVIATLQTQATEVVNDMFGQTKPHAETPVATPAAESLESKEEIVAGSVPPGPPDAEKLAAAVAEDKVITELPELAVQGRLWLAKVPDDSFVLAHKTFSRVKDAQAYIKGKEWLVNARVVPVFDDGKDEASFAVMTGPFRSKDRAKNTIARLGLPSDVTITPVAMALSQTEPRKSKP